MRAILLLTLACTLSALDHAEARHLLLRTGFAPSLDEIEALLPLDREDAVEQLLDGVEPDVQVKPPEWTRERLDRFWKRSQKIARELDKPATDGEAMMMQLKDLRGQQGTELKAWWFDQMVAAESPLTERLTLLWHNHFTSELEVVEEPRWIWEQHVLYRQNCMGNFGTFCLRIPLDPAMFHYLDSDSNQAAQPNENFAREVMELFTLGEGNYSEQDIKDAARAFTGYQINPKTGRPEQQRGFHDNGKKSVLGHEGSFDANDIITVLLLREEKVALHLAERLWREFIDERPEPDQIRQLAAVFYKGKYELRPLLEAVLLHERFWAEDTRGRLVKSPAELLVGAVRQLGLAGVTGAELAPLSAELGMDLFDPPGVKGWSGYTNWINTDSLAAGVKVRKQLLKGRELGAADGHWLRGLAELEEFGPPLVEATMVPFTTTPPPEGLTPAELALHLLAEPAYLLK